MTYQRNETPEPLASTTTTEAFETGLRAEFEALARVSEMNVKRNAAGNGYAHLMTQVAWDFYRAATERAAKQEWLPIATAPKDGTRMILWVVHPNAKFAADPIGEGWACHTTGAWIDFNGGGWSWHGMSGEPTHWMPLPDAPNAAASIGSGKESAS